MDELNIDNFEVTLPSVSYIEQLCALQYFKMSSEAHGYSTIEIDKCISDLTASYESKKKRDAIKQIIKDL
jgi:hypothetical protein